MQEVVTQSINCPYDRFAGRAHLCRRLWAIVDGDVPPSLEQREDLGMTPLYGWIVGVVRGDILKGAVKEGAEHRSATRSFQGESLSCHLRNRRVKA